MKRCPHCNRDLPLSEFGICRSRPDGLNLYCKESIRQKTAEHRMKLRQYRETTRRRKPCIKSQPIWRLAISDREKVRLAYRRGITDRVEIRRATKIWMHDLMEIIAELNDSGVIKWDREAQCFRAA